MDLASLAEPFMPLTGETKSPTGRRATRKRRRRLEREAKKAKRVASQRGRGRNAVRADPSQRSGRGNTEARLEADPSVTGAHRGKSAGTKASNYEIVYATFRPDLRSGYRPTSQVEKPYRHSVKPIPVTVARVSAARENRLQLITLTL